MNPKLAMVYMLSYLATLVLPMVVARAWKDGDIRLVGGGRRYQGTILLYRKRRWGAICDAQWGVDDAEVACKQMGFDRAVAAPTESKFGSGRREWPLFPSCVYSVVLECVCVFCMWT